MKQWAAVLLFPIFLYGAEPSSEVRDLLNKMIAAKGGEQNLSQVKSLQMTVAAIIPSTDQKVRITTRSTRSRVHILTELPGKVRTMQVFDGTAGWAYDKATGIRDLTGSEKNALLSSTLNAARNLERVYDDLKIGATQPFNNVECITLVANKKGDTPTRYFIAKDTYRVVGTQRTTKTAGGDVTGTTAFRRFTRSAGGILYPSEIVIKAGSTALVGIVVDYLENPDFPPQLFQKPAGQPIRKK